MASSVAVLAFSSVSFVSFVVKGFDPRSSAQIRGRVASLFVSS